jgi:hypothetical protein
VLSAVVAALVGSVLLGFGRKETETDAEIDLEAAQEKSAATKAQGKTAPAA